MVTSVVVRSILRNDLMPKSYSFEQMSDADGYLERTFLSPASLRAAELIIKWMQDAGLKTYSLICLLGIIFLLDERLTYMVLTFRWVDQMGNVHGRIESVNKTERTLLIGSHFVSLPENLFSICVFEFYEQRSPL